MATADQIKSLIRSYSEEDRERFYSIALQMAAHEAKQGHATLAHEIRELVDNHRKRVRKSLTVVPFPQELKGLVVSETSDTPFKSLVAPKDTLERFHRVVKEFYQRSKLQMHGLSNRRRVLLAGPPGTGKTMSARVLAHELKLPLYTVQVDRLVTKFMGETSAKLRQIFDIMGQKQGVYFFDEFDAIGGDRSLDNDVGEMRRVLNALLQFIELDQSDSIIIAATNNPKLLDQALFRRFDDVIYYTLPDESECKQLIEIVLGGFLATRFAWRKVLSTCENLSQAEIGSACRDAIKEAVLHDRSKVTSTDLIYTLNQRRQVYSSL
ncbi:ATPase of the AAA+ class [Hahella chejuensis KCTC 2396]|uniref:ATPase of the AAA+ class n=1 Tax=Hahella chejuensis (strain KCTC 2396) TaxID=349521 RepID=Q2SGR1_HAHCH|nr:ATP-binding protein [Hahella chejuensis]ABC30163.1 ATPase of the AAA+ class [Hahella chejuensis KCTC 2396]